MTMKRRHTVTAGSAVVVAHQVGIVFGIIKSSACGISGVVSMGNSLIRSKCIISEIVDSGMGRCTVRLPDLGSNNGQRVLEFHGCSRLVVCHSCTRCQFGAEWVQMYWEHRVIVVAEDVQKDRCKTLL